MEQTPRFLEYYLSGKQELLIITLVGTLDDPTANVLASCIDEFKVRNESFGVLYLRDIHDEISETQYVQLREFIQVMKNHFPKGIRICSLKPKLRLAFTQRELCEEEAFANNLKEIAIQVAGL